MVYIPLVDVHKRCVCSSTREVSILLSEAINVEKRCEVCFHPMKKRFNILVIPDWSYSQRTLGLIMYACIILYNIIIDVERDDDYDENYHIVTSVVAPPINYEVPVSLTNILSREAHLTSGLIFLNLQSDLIEHVWNKFH
jgi:hypothetical protein